MNKTMKRNCLQATAVAALVLGATHAFVGVSNLRPRLDTEGKIVDAHDGCLHKFGDRYFLYGAAYGNTDGFGNSNRYRCYSSKDLVEWKFEGEVLKDAPEGVYYRPYVAFNKKTGKYVLWYNWYPRLWNGQYGVATSDTPQGPYAIQNNNVKVAHATPGDLNLMVDEDGTGYLIYTSIANNHSISIEKLTPDFLATTLENSGFLANGCEAPALFKRQKRYYALFDGCCCFGPEGSGAQVWIAEKPLGPYTQHGNINRDYTGNPIIPAQQTFVAQLPISRGTAYIWMGDRWGSRPDGVKGHDFQYWSRPLEFAADGTILPLQWDSNFSDSDFNLPPRLSPDQIVIESAIYGDLAGKDPARIRDVTAKVQAALRRGNGSFKVGFLAEGDDPCQGTVKTLRVQYRVKDRLGSFSGTDTDVADLLDTDEHEGGGVGLCFNGSGQHARFVCPGTGVSAEGLTVEFWMRVDRTTSLVPGQQAVMALGGKPGKDPELVIQLAGDKGQNRLGVWADGSDARALAVIPDSLLHFVAVTCAGKELQLHVDGVIMGTAQLKRPLNFKSGECTVGGCPAKGWHFRGSVGPITFWRGARSAAQVARDMLDFNTIESPCLTGKETNLIARIPLDEGAGTTFADLTRAINGTLEGGAAWNKPVALAPEPYSEGIWFVIQNKADIDTDVGFPPRRLALTPDGQGGVVMERVPDKGDYDRFLWRAEMDASGRFFTLVNKYLGEEFALECSNLHVKIGSRRTERVQAWMISVANLADWGGNAYFLESPAPASSGSRIALRDRKVVVERKAHGDTGQAWVFAPMEIALGYCLPRNPDVAQTPYTRRLETGMGQTVVGTTTSAEWTLLNAQLVLRNMIIASCGASNPANRAKLDGWTAITWSPVDDRGGITTNYPITKPLWDACQEWGTYPGDNGGGQFIMTESILMRKGPDWPCVREFSNPIHEFAHGLEATYGFDAEGHFSDEETFPWAVQYWFKGASEMGPRVTRLDLTPDEKSFLETVFRKSNTWLPPRWLRTQQPENLELGAGESLRVGEKLNAYYGGCAMTIQRDGNVVVKDGEKLRWGSHQSLKLPLNSIVSAGMSADGRLVLRDAGNKQVWSSKACGAGARLVVVEPDTSRGEQPGSYLRIIAGDGSVAWQSE